MSTPDDPERTASWLRFSHLGIQFCVMLLLGTGAGAWADTRLHTEPWLLVTGSLLGMVMATYTLVRATARIGK
jgi:F0F1-type ATP synthase assembly protein I